MRHDSIVHPTQIVCFANRKDFRQVKQESLSKPFDVTGVKCLSNIV